MRRLRAVRYRQALLFTLGLCVLALVVLPYPHGGVYEFVSGNVTVTGTYPALTLPRQVLSALAGAVALAYLAVPLYLRVRDADR